MRFLLDTNILIHREDPTVTSSEIQDLFKHLLKAKVELVVHPASYEDIEQDKDERRKEELLSKIACYPILENPPSCDVNTEFVECIGAPKIRNDEVDHALLCAIWMNAAFALLTEDKVILTKSERLGIRDQVFTVEEATSWLLRHTGEFTSKRTKPLARVEMCDLDLQDPFFDSLREDYPAFNEWFMEKQQSGRKAFVWRDSQKKMRACYIPKVENEPISLADGQLPKKRRLKICTLKTVETGAGIGELFIKLAVNQCISSEIDEIYITAYSDKHILLNPLLKRYGFYQVGRKSNGEAVFAKQLVPPPEARTALDAYKGSRHYYPSFYRGNRVKKFIVPIRPEYHRRLFFDAPAGQQQLDGYLGEIIVEGNTIDKAYLCNSNTRRVGRGSILLFYRSLEDQAITALGVVHKVKFDVTDLESALGQVGGRTVYSEREVQDIVSRGALILIFRHHLYLKRAITSKELETEGIFDRPPRSITSINDRKYRRVVKLGGLDGRYSYD